MGLGPDLGGDRKRTHMIAKDWKEGAELMRSLTATPLEQVNEYCAEFEPDLPFWERLVTALWLAYLSNKTENDEN